MSNVDPKDYTKVSAKLRARIIKRRLKQAERITLRHAHRFIIGRISNLRDVQKHAIAWVLLIGIVIAAGIFQTNFTKAQLSVDAAQEGGTYTEGALGEMTNLNPIFVTTQAERAASRLLFANLLTYDNEGDLVGELAESWGPDSTGKVYTLKLKPNAKWSDGVPVSADDVLYTFNTIKNVDTRSPLYSNWRNVSVEKVDQTTVKFKLPTTQAAFVNFLAVGIIPYHVLGQIQPSELRTADFNRHPNISSGVFKFQTLQTVDPNKGHYLLTAEANKRFVLGAPKLDGFHLHAYRESEDLVRAFRVREIEAFTGATTSQLKTLSPDIERINSPLFNGVYAFLNTSNPELKDLKVRKALRLATSQEAIIQSLDNSVRPLDGPLVDEQTGRQAEPIQPSIEQAAKLLDQAGWKLNKEGKRQKGKRLLTLQLRTVSLGDYPVVAEELLKQWTALGINFDSQLIKPDDIQQNVILPRAYDVLIYEIALGRDPDVYAYWHSSQANERGLNLSNYRSPTVDDALDSARSQLGEALRDVKYRLFVKEWNADVPAVPLYRTTLAYVQNDSVITFEEHPLITAQDRYFNVRYWSADIGRVLGTR